MTVNGVDEPARPGGSAAEGHPSSLVYRTAARVRPLTGFWCFVRGDCSRARLRFGLFRPQRFDRVDARGPSRGEVAFSFSDADRRVPARPSSTSKPPAVCAWARAAQPSPNMNDLRYAFRQLALSRGLSTVIVLSLALGIGANATVFSRIETLLLRPLPGVAHPEELIILTTSQGGRMGDTVSRPPRRRRAHGRFRGVRRLAADARMPHDRPPVGMELRPDRHCQFLCRAAREAAI